MQGLVPMQTIVDRIQVAIVLIELLKIVVGHEFGLDVINGISQPVLEFVEIFFVQENFVLFVGIAAIGVDVAFAFRDGDVVILGSRGFYVHKISASSGSDAA